MLLLQRHVMLVQRLSHYLIMHAFVDLEPIQMELHARIVTPLVGLVLEGQPQAVQLAMQLVRCIFLVQIVDKHL